MPAGVTGRVLAPALRLYPLFRPRHAARLKACFAAAPFPGSLNLRAYYTTRLRLLLRGLASHGNPSAPQVTVHGRSHYRDALQSGRPIALLGLHAGMVELLHRVPEAQPGRPFLILTSPAFSPPLTRFMARGRELDGKRILWVGNGKRRPIANEGTAPGQRGMAAAGQRGLEQGLRSVIAKNGVLALMADQHPGPAEECEYLMLWNRVRVPWPARLIRFLSDQGFRFVPISTRLIREDAHVEFHPALPEADAEGIRAFLEKAIADAPEQWNWSYPKIGI
jgi:lauroyl/myristoyl acyltransferase